MPAPDYLSHCPLWPLTKMKKTHFGPRRKIRRGESSATHSTLPLSAVAFHPCSALVFPKK